MTAFNDEQTQNEPGDQNADAQPHIHKNIEQNSDDGAEIKKRQNYWKRFISYIEKNEKVINATSTIFIASFTVVLAIATIFLYCATRNLVTGANEAAARQLRAYVYFDGPNPRPWPPEKPNRLSVILDYINSGHTWARNLTIQKAIVRQKGTEGRDPFGSVDWGKDVPSTIVLGPTQKITLQFGDIDFTEFPLIEKEKHRVYFVALIKYEDTVSSPSRIHQTQLSRRFLVDSEGHFSFEYLPTHNCADEDCPN